MAQIDKPNLHFNPTLYTGNESARSITGVGFQPDFVWIKDRDQTFTHHLFDAVRGATKRLKSDTNDSEATNAQGFTSFDSDGFSLGTDNATNGNGSSIASWNWKGANGTASNSNGTITSTVSANPTAGFSVVSYTANGTQGATVGHGLSSAPEMVMTKDRSATGNWGVYHVGQHVTSPEDYYLELNSNAATSDFTYWNDTKPSNTVVTIGNANANNTNGRNIIMYCFHSVKGYSKLGYYTALGTSTNGAFIYTGFKPAWVLIKRYNSPESWYIFDSKRDVINPNQAVLYPNLNNAEGSLTGGIDLLSNGFKIRSHNSAVGSGDSYIYMAIAENPIVGSNNIPATAT